MASQKKEEPPKKKITHSRIVTMDSIRNRHSTDNDEVAYYAGGSEHSGQQVLGPGKRKRGNEDSHNLTEGNALAHALHHAAQSIRFEDDQPNKSRPIFGGVGYRLGDSHSPHRDTENGGNQIGVTHSPRRDTENGGNEIGVTHSPPHDTESGDNTEDNDIRDSLENNDIKENLQNDEIKDNLQNDVIMDNLQNDAIKDDLQTDAIKDNLQTDAIKDNLQNDDGANLETNASDDPDCILDDNMGSPESHVTISDDNSIEILSDSRNLDSDDDDDLHYVPGYANNDDGEGDSPYLMIRNHGTGEEGEVYVNVTLYEDGFTIDGGPLKSYEDPSCSKLIEYIKKGAFPSELIPEGSRKSVSVSVYDKRNQQYIPPRTVLKAFSGKGHLLGSPTPAVSPVNSDTAESASTNHQTESTSFDFSTENPTTSLKIRLPDGSVLQFKVNLNCSVATLRCFILKARPHLSAFEFSLFSTFPRREFSDMSETVEEAGLKNSCLVVQIT